MKQKNRQLINGLPRRILLMLLDCGLIVFCYYLAILLRFDGEDSIVPAAVLRAEVIRAMAPMLPYVLVIYIRARPLRRRPKPGTPSRMSGSILRWMRICWREWWQTIMGRCQTMAGCR